jgi:hypothetical protein
MSSGLMDGLKQRGLILVCFPPSVPHRKGLSLDKSFTFGVLAAVASGLMVIFLTYTGYAASTFPISSTVLPFLIPRCLSWVPFYFVSNDEANKQNEEKHGQQAVQPAEQIATNVHDQDKWSQSLKDSPYPQIRKLLSVKLKLPALGLRKMQMRGLGCWWVMIPVRRGVELGLLIRLWGVFDLVK